MERWVDPDQSKASSQSAEPFFFATFKLNEVNPARDSRNGCRE
jgi:hypothetical protein